MKVLITGTSRGIGRAIALKFLKEGSDVIGIDVESATIDNACYRHIIADISCDDLPYIDGIEILVNNAGVQNSADDISVNLKGTMRVTEKYAFQPNIASVLFVASASARTGSEFPAYAASKGGVVAYMRNVALRLAEYGATANSISPGGVTTELNDRVMRNPDKWARIMAETLLPKWATPEEIAEWAYFVTVINKSMTGEDILIDNGESIKSNFIW